MNTNTLKAALSAFTGKKFVVIDHKEYSAASWKSPAIVQDSMYVADVGYIVTRCYGGGFEVYKVENDSVSVQYFKEI